VVLHVVQRGVHRGPVRGHHLLPPDLTANRGDETDALDKLPAQSGGTTWHESVRLAFFDAHRHPGNRREMIGAPR